MPASDRPDAHQRPRFAPGARVRVRDSRPERLAPMHLRTPHYVRGRTGTVERALGAFANPEAIAFARPGEPRMLYHVVFDQPPIWNEGAPGDTVMIEIFEHWLEEAP
jgi:nitrile hydratase